MGYDLDRFVGGGAVKAGLLCCICRDVLEDALQASNTCQHAYCRACIYAWLVQEHSCPECRTPLHSKQLKPIFRYMKNDLDQLQIRCSYCDVTCSLEHLALHESRDCPERPASSEPTPTHCPTCAQYVSGDAELQRHLAEECAFRPLDEGRRECPHGCGMELISSEDMGHSCIAELRTAVELARAELLCRLGEQREEMETRLGTQREQMERRDQAVKQHLHEIRGQLVRLQRDIADMKRERDMQRQERQGREQGTEKMQTVEQCMEQTTRREAQ